MRIETIYALLDVMLARTPRPGQGARSALRAGDSSHLPGSAS